MNNKTNQSNNLRYEKAMSLLIECEKNCITARQRVIDEIRSSEEFEEYKKGLIKSNEINISLSNDIISVDMPLISPFKKIKKLRTFPANISNSENAKYKLWETLEKANSIIEPLEYALTEFILNNNIENMFNNSIFEYINFYSSTITPDVDNYEYKQITDVVSSLINNGDDNFITFIIKSGFSKEPHTLLNIYPDEYCYYVKKRSKLEQ